MSMERDDDQLFPLQSESVRQPIIQPVKSLLMGAEDDSSVPIVLLEGLSKSYRMAEAPLHVLQDVHLSIYSGQHVAIMGRSGSGKSTLMNIMGLLDVADEGDYYFDGRRVSSLSPDERARCRGENIGFVFQSFHLLPRLTVWENVSLPLIYSPQDANRSYDELQTVRKALAMEKLAAVDLTSHAEYYPAKLSGGQQQRVAIARALINEPKLILADEPTGSLDADTGNTIMEVFEKLNRVEGRTIVMITHDADIAARCPVRYTMHQGHLHPFHL
jgi:putative ABC transport system ATP-binding protein